MKKILFILLAGLLIWSCSKSDDSESSLDNVTNSAGTYITSSYMETFFTPKSLELIIPRLEESNATFIADISGFRGNGATCTEYPNYSWCHDSILSKFHEYVVFYGDTSYCGMHSQARNGNGCMMPLKSISIVADKDLDEAHPAGTLLNDLFDIRYPRYNSYIKSGYLPRLNVNDYVLDSISPLSDFKGEILFPEDAKFYLKKHPSNKGKYTFTVTLTFDKDPVSGESLELAPASIEIEF
ncbi:MAG: hypothetical protein J5595_06540 [Bacteroidales bacterium]|nr:hypothetical protein [Bacteroidales bacterium]